MTTDSQEGRTRVEEPRGHSRALGTRAGGQARQAAVSADRGLAARRSFQGGRVPTAGGRDAETGAHPSPCCASPRAGLFRTAPRWGRRSRGHAGTSRTPRRGDSLPGHQNWKPWTTCLLLLGHGGIPVPSKTNRISSSLCGPRGQGKGPENLTNEHQQL